jgi:hypothetical protein
MAGFYDHNLEEADSMYTRPTLDAYIVGKYWNFLTKGLSQEEIADLQETKKNLDHYTRIYELMEYGQKISLTMLILETRLDTNDVSLP